VKTLLGGTLSAALGVGAAGTVSAADERPHGAECDRDEQCASNFCCTGLCPECGRPRRPVEKTGRCFCCRGGGLANCKRGF
jgi:hypothetical protein